MRWAASLPWRRFWRPSARTCRCATPSPSRPTCGSSIRTAKLKQLGVDLPAEQLDDREVLIILDTTAWAQLGAMAEVVKTSQGRQGGARSSRQRGRPGGRTVQGRGGRGHRPAGGRSGRPVGRAADARDRAAGVRRPGDRHGLVPFLVDHGRYVAACRAAGRGGRRAGPALQGALRDRQPRPAATDRPGAGPHADRVGRPLDLHVDRARRISRPPAPCRPTARTSST